MTPLQISLWVLLLVVQNASFTWVSRARNSGSDWYHAFAAVFSNGVWFAAFFYTFAGIEIIRETGSPLMAAGLGALYIVATVTGSVSSGMFLRRFVEKGKRKVGHYEEQAREIAELKAWAGGQILNVAGLRERLIDLDDRLQQFELDAGPVEAIDPEALRAQARVLTGPASAIYRFEGPEAAAEARERSMREIDHQEYIREREVRERKYD